MKLAEWQIVEALRARVRQVRPVGQGRAFQMKTSDRNQLLHWLDAQQGAIRLIAGGRSDDELRAPPQPGKWSALQHLAHLARIHDVYLARIHRILTEDAPALPAYRAEQDGEWPGWEGLALADILSRLHDRRAELVARLRTLSDDQWTRVGRHANVGPLTLAEWIEFFLVHEGHHLYMALTLARRITGRPEKPA